ERGAIDLHGLFPISARGRDAASADARHIGAVPTTLLPVNRRILDCFTPCRPASMEARDRAVSPASSSASQDGPSADTYGAACYRASAGRVEVLQVALCPDGVSGEFQRASSG